ncbi:MAG: mechanosensitive ion channel family protein [Anaerolineae bacterium]|nr:mechanosensitive ion channel family protein [Anaerolineae bacterium]
MLAIYNLLMVDSAIGFFLRLILIIIITWVLMWIGRWVAFRILASRSKSWSDVDRGRLLTLESLIGSAVNVVAYIVGFILVLISFGISGGSILTSVALFSAGFGFAARPIISDYLAGIILIFEDQFSVGEKVEMLETTGKVEAVSLRTTKLRGDSGELYIVPNGDVRIIRNLSRGLFSVATVKVTVGASDLNKSLRVLEEFADSAQQKFPDLIERPEFLSEEGDISAHVQLTVSAKAQYGRGARLRTRLMARITEMFEEAGINVLN